MWGKNMVNNNFTELPKEYDNEISAYEKLTVEFKISYAESAEIRETMIAFANAVGGRIYVGVREVENKSGLRVGEVIGVSKLGISDANSDVRQWACLFIPKIEISFNTYRKNEKRIDIIKVEESKQKPVCNSAGLYKIRTSDGNTGVDPAKLRQMIVGYDSFKSALILECDKNLELLDKILTQATENPPQASFDELAYSTVDAILANGTLSSFFQITELNEIKHFSIQINKLLDFAISAGDIIFDAVIFYDKIVELCPVLQKKVSELLIRLR
jgi:predicted HTH transcriptional regulator